MKNKISSLYLLLFITHYILSTVVYPNSTLTFPIESNKVIHSIALFPKNNAVIIAQNDALVAYNLSNGNPLYKLESLFKNFSGETQTISRLKASPEKLLILGGGYKKGEKTE